MDFIYLYEITKKPLAIALSGARGREGGEMMGVMQQMYNISLIGIFIMNHLSV
jgi:hypothetical protein